jgi:low affinity Fe/Cu permease
MYDKINTCKGVKMGNITLTILEISIGVFVETIILGFVFQMIQAKSDDSMEKAIEEEMNNIETQNKFIYEQLQKEILRVEQSIMSALQQDSRHMMSIGERLPADQIEKLKRELK